MSENIKTGWLKDSAGQKFAPNVVDTTIYNQQGVQLNGIDQAMYPINDSNIEENFTPVFESLNASKLGSSGILYSIKNNNTYYFFKKNNVTILAKGQSGTTLSYKDSNGNANPFGSFTQITFYYGGGYFFAGTCYGWTVDSGSYDDNWCKFAIYYSADGITWSKGWESGNRGGANNSAIYHQPVLHWTGSSIKMFSIYGTREVDSLPLIGSFYVLGPTYISTLTGTLSSGSWSWSEQHTTKTDLSNPVLMGGGYYKGNVVLFLRAYNNSTVEHIYTSNGGTSWTRVAGTQVGVLSNSYVAAQFEYQNYFGFATTKGEFFITDTSLRNPCQRAQDSGFLYALYYNPPFYQMDSLLENDQLWVVDNEIYINKYNGIASLSLTQSTELNPGLFVTELEDDIFYLNDTNSASYYIPNSQELLIISNTKVYIYDVQQHKFTNYNVSYNQNKLIKNVQNQDITTTVQDIIFPYYIIHGSNNALSRIPLPDPNAVPRFIQLSNSTANSGIVSLYSSNKLSLGDKLITIKWDYEGSQINISGLTGNYSYTVWYEIPKDIYTIRKPIFLGRTTVNKTITNYTKWTDVLSFDNTNINGEYLSNKSYLIQDELRQNISVHGKIIDTPNYANLTIKNNWAKYNVREHYKALAFYEHTTNNTAITSTATKTVTETPQQGSQSFTLSESFFYDMTNNEIAFETPLTEIPTTWAELIGYYIIFNDDKSKMYKITNYSVTKNKDTGVIETTSLSLTLYYIAQKSYDQTGEPLATFKNRDWGTKPEAVTIVQGNLDSAFVGKVGSTLYYYTII